MKYKTIIIGAGTAGIFAGRELEDDFIILEAAADIGGRCRTHFSRSGKAHELGAAFLHSQSENPFAQWLVEQGHKLVMLDPTEHIVIDGRVLDEQELREFHRAYDDIVTRADILITRNPAARANELLSGDEIHDAAVYAFAASTETGVELDELSLIDVAGQAAMRDHALLSGSIQDALRAAARDLPVELNTAVTAIDYSGAEIRLATTRGEYLCNQLIITASVDVVLDKIEFSPPLPPEKIQAMEHLRQGVLNKQIVKFKERLWPSGESFYAFFTDAQHGQCEVWIMPHAPSTLHILCGGRRGHFTYAEFCDCFLPQLQALLPALEDNEIDWQQSTDWRNEPYVRGSYSVLRTGDMAAREIYAEPLEGRIFFAGEAAGGEWSTQLPGAMLSGQAAAQQIIQA